MWASISFIFLLLALLAEIVGTIGGFGSSVFFVPLANFFFSFHVVLGLTAAFHLISNLTKIALFRKGIDKNLLVYIGIPAVLFVILGGYLSGRMDDTNLELILGIFLVLLSTVFLIRPNLVIPQGKKESILGGTLSGLTAGLLGTGGAIRGLTMAAYNLEKSVYIATSALIDFFVDLSRTFVYYQNGYFSNKIILYYLPFLVLVGILGTYFGKRMLEKIAQQTFRKISLTLILLIGIVTLTKFAVEHF